MKKVLVVFGGRSVEHDISIITGQVIIAALKASPEFAPIPLYITTDGRWFSDPALADIETFQDADFTGRLKKLKPVSLTAGNGLTVVQPGLRGKSIKPDVVFPAMHGTNGEDGSLPGLCRLTGVPFVGCDVAASAVAMDKVLTKQITAQAGVPSVPYLWFTESDWARDPTPIRQQIKGLKLPLYVKPAHLGSSIGISRVDKLPQLDQALELAFHYDTKVLVEQGVTNLLEVNCSVLGNDNPRPSVLEQPVARSEFLSFDDKYLGSGKKGGSMTGAKSSVKIPAPVDERLTKRIQTLAVTAYRAIGAAGICRLDFLIDQTDRQAYLNEINPLPGSLQQHVWQASGLSQVELVTTLVDLAGKRQAAEATKTNHFSSSVLSRRHGAKPTGQA